MQNMKAVAGLIHLIVVGAGVLAMPLAFSHMGILPGMIVIIWSGLTAGFGLYLQTRCARYLDRGAASFFALSQITYPKASVIFDAAIAIKCFGVGVSYLIIIGDLMPGVILGLNSNVDLHGVLMDRRFWVTAFMLVTPALRQLTPLLMTLQAYCDTLLFPPTLRFSEIHQFYCVGFNRLSSHPSGGALHHWRHSRPERSGARSDLAKSYCVSLESSSHGFCIHVSSECESQCQSRSNIPDSDHAQMFSILNEMNNPAPAKTTAVVTTSIGTAGTIYTVVAITGYISYGDNVAGNIVSMCEYIPTASLLLQFH